MHADPMEGHTAKAFDGALTQLRLHTVGIGKGDEHGDRDDRDRQQVCDHEHELVEALRARRV